MVFGYGFESMELELGGGVLMLIWWNGVPMGEVQWGGVWLQEW